ncbi:MAG: FAD-dependent oxidoreductase, partial [Lachnospiraceae bacterium]|nr:FAD-dependent oxidoreductase [Lachnospiraceae bacterium]
MCKKLHIRPAELIGLTILRRSVDARKKSSVFLRFRLLCELSDRVHLPKGLREHLSSDEELTTYKFPSSGNQPLPHRPVIAGLGPAGLFAALWLAKAGYRPLVLERGKKVEERKTDVDRFFAGGELDPESNVQYGEGGAGAFSDGKLNTSVKDPSGLGREILKTFHSFGAPEEILYDHEAHLGTDILYSILPKFRQNLLELGAELRFSSPLSDLIVRDGKLSSLQISGKETIPCECLVLAIGHSPGDTYAGLFRSGLLMEEKPFAVGFRIEHPQDMIDRHQYRDAAAFLPHASYHLSKTVRNRSVYSFCMCPGGYVVNASSEPERLLVNGMSYSGRNSGNANSAVLVNVKVSDYQDRAPFEGLTPLRGFSFLRELESACYIRGKGAIPQQLLGDFKQDIITSSYGEIESCHKGGAVFASLRGLLPREMEEAFLDGLEAFGQRIPGFDRKDAVLSGIETRTSSPIRIPRKEDL